MLCMWMYSVKKLIAKLPSLGVVGELHKIFVVDLKQKRMFVVGDAKVYMVSPYGLNMRIT